MKILLTGATGFIGNEILEQCIAHNYVSHVYCLTRTQLDRKYATHKKVTQIIHEDFSQYPEYLLAKLVSYKIEGCIWALGGQLPKFKTKEEAETVNIHYTISAANAFASSLATQLDPKLPPMKQKFPFRFIFMSAWGAEQNPFASLWMYADSRKLKGATEKGVFDIADNCQEIEGQKCFDAIALRAGGVLPKGEGVANLLSEATMPYILVNRLARCAIRVALEGTTPAGKKILENKECLGDDWGMINTFTI